MQAALTAPNERLKTKEELEETAKSLLSRLLQAAVESAVVVLIKKILGHFHDRRGSEP